MKVTFATKFIVCLALLLSASPAFAAQDALTAGCTVAIPEDIQEGTLMTVFANGGTSEALASDWNNDAQNKGWKQLGFNDSTKGRDITTSVFYKRNIGNEQNPTFTLTGSNTSPKCNLVAYTDAYYFGNTSESEIAFSSEQETTVFLLNHPKGQVKNTFEYRNKKNTPVFAFNLITDDSAVTLQSVALKISAIQGVTEAKVKNFVLYKDINEDAIYTKGVDKKVSKTTSVLFSGAATSSILFTDIKEITNGAYIVTANTKALKTSDTITVSLASDGITFGQAVSISATGTVSSVTHERYSGVSFTKWRGSNYGGELIGNDSNYYWPTAHTGEWLFAQRAYDQLDGSYSTDSNGDVVVFKNFNIPTGSLLTISGIEVKIEASEVDGTGGYLEIDMSWDGGTSWTATELAPQLTVTDSVVYVGASSYQWGRGSSVQGLITTNWKADDFTNANFRLRVKSNSSTGMVQIDGVQVRVYSVINNVPFG